MDGFFWVIVVIAIVGSLISSASKKKKQEEARRAAQQRQPQQRSMPLSDIEKAFMMAQQQNPQQSGYAQPRPQYAPPQAAHPYMSPDTYAPQAAQRPAYTPPPAYTAPQAATYTPMQARSAAPMEARNNAPMQARSAAAVPPHPMYANQTKLQTGMSGSTAFTPLNTSYAGSLGTVTSEGSTERLEGVKDAKLESVTDVNLETIVDADAPVRAIKQPVKPVAHMETPLGLFGNKNEYVKAVIYAEILNRRTTGRARRAN